jgi:hypothetical protein
MLPSIQFYVNSIFRTPLRLMLGVALDSTEFRSVYNFKIPGRCRSLKIALTPVPLNGTRSGLFTRGGWGVRAGFSSIDGLTKTDRYLLIRLGVTQIGTAVRGKVGQAVGQVQAHLSILP